MLEELFELHKNVSFEKFKEHSLNSSLRFEEVDKIPSTGKVWKSSILLGNSEIQFCFVTSFTTLSVLAIANSVFEKMDERNYFDHVSDFMREYNNLLAGQLKGLYNNSAIDVRLSLPLLSTNFSTEACFGKSDFENLNTSAWAICSDNSYILIENIAHISSDFDPNRVSVLTEQREQIEGDTGEVEFF